MITKRTILLNSLIVMLIVAFYSQTYAKVRPRYDNISPQQFAQLIQSNQDNPEFIILDVRTSGEISQGKIKNAIELDFYSQTFAAELQKLDKQKTYLVYCRSGNRSGQTLDIMKILKFEQVYNMSGGIREWISQGFSTVR